jgi:hypothetical protein
MNSTLAVQRLGHVNVFAEDYDATLALHRGLFDAKVFAEWEQPDAGAHNALALIGGTCVEVFSPAGSGQAVSGWVAKNGSGWHSLEWTVPSLPDAVETVRERGIRITDTGGGEYVFTHPKDLFGLCLELTAHHFDNDDRDRPGWTPAHWSEEHPLGITGPATVKVASPQPEKAAAAMAALTGREVYTVERTHLNTISHGVTFADHAVEFTGSATGSAGDLLGTFLAQRGPRIFGTAFRIKDFDQARAHLVAENVKFTQWGRHSLLLGPELTNGPLIELTDAG